MSTHVTRRAVLSGIAATTVALPGIGRAEALPGVVVTKNTACGCCDAWVDHLRAAGFPVEVVETSEINLVKIRLGVPKDLASCHSAEVGGYAIEGHVPAHQVKRLLAEKPSGKGLAVPGMPVGSPGMEIDGMAPEIFDVVLFGPVGRKTFARYRGGVVIAV